jgi:hypothetical protein
MSTKKSRRKTLVELALQKLDVAKCVQEDGWDRMGV